MTLVLVCTCGARVRAPNAKPGRVGRCPSCGGRLQVPEPLPDLVSGAEVEVLATIQPPCPEPPFPGQAQAPRSPAPSRALGYGIAPDRAGGPESAPEIVPERAPIGATSKAEPTGTRPRPQTRASRESTFRRSERTSTEPEPGGLVRPPTKPETRFWDSLLYPLWDGPAIALLVALPPVCGVLSVFSFGLRGYLGTGDDVMTMGALTMIFPMLCLLAVVFGYAGMFLADVLQSSAQGEVRHPKVPAWEFFEVFASLGRWAGACAFGIAVGAGLAWAYGTASGALSAAEARPVDELLMAALLGLGAGFWPMPVVSVMLYADLRAANPITVVSAMLRSLGGSIRIGLLFGLAGAVTLMLADLLFALPEFGLLPTLLGIGLFWFLFWYEAIVLARRLGLYYRRHARDLGWFPERPRWGAS